MKTLRFHDYGEPADVLRLEDVAVPRPGAGQIRVRVHACGLNPADWALCRGLFPGDLPRGIGLDVAGTVELMGEGVTDVQIGQPVLGVPDYRGLPSAGAAEEAVLAVWTPVPPGLVKMAALPMAIETACRCLDILGRGGRTNTACVRRRHGDRFRRRADGAGRAACRQEASPKRASAASI